MAAADVSDLAESDGEVWMSSIHGVQTVFLLLLVLVAVFAVVARRLAVPYPIVLVLAGLGISFVPHMPRIPLNPDLVFLIFLPPLLFAAAWQTSWREFRRNFVSIFLLAFGLVAFTVWGVSMLAEHVLAALDWKSGFLLGAVVATTDAIAATSIATSVGLPRRIVHVLEGESLVNDATGLLALEFGLRIMIQGETPSVGAGLMRLLWLTGAGLAVGLAVGWVVAWCERWIDDGDIEIVISLVVPYIAYLAAEELRASGVLAVVACGLYLSRRSVSYFSPEVRIQVTSVWRALNFALNGLVFVLIGLQLPYVLASIHGYSRRTLLLYGAGFSVVLILLRLAWVFPGAALAYQISKRLLGRTEAPPSPRATFVVGWTGMRGVIALAAAISLPMTLSNGAPFAQRSLIIYLTFCVILVTLVVQGLSLPAVIRGLGLSGGSGEDDGEEVEARSRMLEDAIAHIEGERGRADGALVDGFDDLLHTYRHRLSLVRDARARREEPHESLAVYQQMRDALRRASEVERHTLIRLRDDGTIGDEVLRHLQRELDLAEARQMSLPSIRLRPE